MQYLGFKINNFRGIKEANFQLHRKPGEKVASSLWVGLNESGKTTILKAVAYFYDFLLERPQMRENELIPRHMRLNFNETITISATLSVDKDDIKVLRELVVGNFSASPAEPAEITITRCWNTQIQLFRITAFTMMFPALKIESRAKGKKRKNSGRSAEQR